MKAIRLINTNRNWTITFCNSVSRIQNFSKDQLKFQHTSATASFSRLEVKVPTKFRQFDLST